MSKPIPYATDLRCAASGSVGRACSTIGSEVLVMDSTVYARESIDAPFTGRVGSGEPERATALPRRKLVNALTIDVEDYFQVSAFERHVAREDWDGITRRVESNVDRILAMLDESGARATFFTLGWIAERHPAMVRRIVAAGHEIASHSWDHRRVYTLGSVRFRADVLRAKQCLEDISGTAVVGYRAPSYSFTCRTAWAHDVLADTGHLYSSSVAPVVHDHYGMPGASRFAHCVAAGRLLEVPISTTTIAGRNRICAGGGWFRLYPYALTRHLIGRVNRNEQQACVFYFHPWEIDTDQPRMDGLDARTRFRHYLNLTRVEQRLRALLEDFDWAPMTSVFAGQIEALSSAGVAGVDDRLDSRPEQHVERGRAA